MADHVAKDHVPEENQQGQAGIGDPELAGDDQEQRHEGRFGPRLPTRKTVRRPRRGGARLVVVQMGPLEQATQMQAAMHPVEIRIMRHHDQRHLPDQGAD